MLRLCAATPGQGQRTNGAAEGGEHLVVAGVVLIIRKGHAEFGGIRRSDARLAVNSVDLHNARNLPDGQWVQQNRIDHGEDGGIGSDSERQ